MRKHSLAAKPPLRRQTRVAWTAAWILVWIPGSGHGADPAPFVEVATESGLDFVHFNGMSGELYFSEVAGAGVGVLDCDGDGDLDVVLSQGAMLGAGKTLKDALHPPRVGMPAGDRLYRNELQIASDGTRTLKFRDVTEISGLRATAYGMGFATGDFDNDGAVDLYVTNFGDDQLWRNNGDCTFTDVTKSAGAGGSEWSVSATFVDFDRDGWLDLYVGNYVDFSIRTHKPCYSTSSARDYCGPRAYNPVPDRLLRNRGDGTFQDVSAVSGIAAALGGALGVIAADFDLDGWPDFYVANDQLANQLWINQKKGEDGLVRFVNEAALAGVAVNMDGSPEASMGVDAADFDGDGDDDIFLTHLNRQTNTIYVNEGDGWFSDKTMATGLGAPSVSFTSFGTAWVDFDNDSWVDLVIANGAVQVIEELALAKDPFPLHQPNQLFHNRGGAGGAVRFDEITAAAGAAFELSEVSRGAAFGDLDNDGDTDVVITNNNGPARLLRNEVGSRRAWLGLRLLDPELERDALGARVAVELAGGRTLWRRVRADGSFASANDPRVLFGLGQAPKVEEVRVVWPDGSIETWRDVGLRRYTTLEKGGGAKPASQAKEGQPKR